MVNDEQAANAAPSTDAAPTTDADGRRSYSAEVRRTTHGVAHISADSWADLGFGQGWAIACDHLPTIADQIVKVRSERALFRGAGPSDVHLASDLGYLALGISDRAEAFRSAQEPYLAELIRGYVAGYNHRVAEVLAAPDLLPDWCRDAAWIRPIEELDLYRYLVDVALMGSGRNLAPLIGWAQPPGPDGPLPAPSMEALSGPSPASNGWAFGGDATRSGGGLVFANPHFPWTGEARFWECHLSIPGEFDAYGVCLLGAPGIQMGFNRHLGWAHTFSKGHRFTVYQLALGESPTTYRYGEEVRDMTSESVAVKVRSDDDSIETVERELYRTHHGPVLALPLLGWSEQMAFSYRDANIDNTEVLSQFMGMARATSMEEFQQVFAVHKGLPWVNTLAADDRGTAWYTDASATPNLSDAAQQRFRERLETDLVAAMAFEARIAMLDGSEPDDEWVEEPGSRSPGLVAADRLPSLGVRDVVINANDSHWAPHLTHRLEGYPVLCGLERVPLSMRSRRNLTTSAALAAGGVTTDDVIDALYRSPGLSAELLRDDVVRRCLASGGADLESAAEVLAGWDMGVTVDAVGAVLWREFMYGFDDAAWRRGPGLFDVHFDVEDPIHTPRGLAAAAGDDAADPVLAAMRAALAALAEAGIDADQPLGSVQWAARGDERVPVPGGDEGDGVLNIMTPKGALASTSLDPLPRSPAAVPGRGRSGLAEGGYPETYGASFIMAVEFTASGPVGQGLLAYGQSGDPRSPHHADGTRAFAEGRLRPLRFTEQQILDDPELSGLTVASATPRVGGATDSDIAAGM